SAPGPAPSRCSAPACWGRRAASPSAMWPGASPARWYRWSPRPGKNGPPIPPDGQMDGLADGGAQRLVAPAGTLAAVILDDAGVGVDDAGYGDPHADQQLPLGRMALFQRVEDAQQLAHHGVVVLRH